MHRLEALSNAHADLVKAAIHEIALDEIDHISAKVELIIKVDQHKHRLERKELNGGVK